MKKSGSLMGKENEVFCFGNDSGTVGVQVQQVESPTEGNAQWRKQLDKLVIDP